MLSETLKQELGTYRIGEKLRSLRLRRKLRLSELSAHTGLSVGMLSKIETGRMIPTLPTLARVALVFDVGLEHFFLDETRRHPVSIVRARDRVRLPSSADAAAPAFYFESLDFPSTDRALHSYVASFEPVEVVQYHTHEGEELIYVIEGTLGLTALETEYELGAGDSAHFRGTIKHGYRSMSSEPCQAVVVTTE